VIIISVIMGITGILSIIVMLSHADIYCCLSLCIVVPPFVSIC
jgi:hypothetical protein